MKRTRDWRRAQKDRYLKKAVRFYKEVARLESSDINNHRRAVTRCPCSSWCCGNPRTHFNAVTMQELKFTCSHEGDLSDVGMPNRKEEYGTRY